MAVFVGTLSADNAAQRFKGIEDAIAGKNIEIVDKREDSTDRAKARSNVEDIINAHSDLNLVAGLWSYNGPAIAAAIEALGKKGKVLAAVFDEEEGTLNGIAERHHCRHRGAEAVSVRLPSSKWMHELATKRRERDARRSSRRDKAHRHRREVITKDNVAEFKEQLAEMKQVATCPPRATTPAPSACCSR